MTIVRWPLYCAIVVVVMWFAATNFHSVKVSFTPLPWIFEFPVYLLVLAGILIGLVFGFLTSLRNKLRNRREIRLLRRDYALLETEMARRTATDSKIEASLLSSDQSK